MSTGQFVLDLGHRPALGREDFLVAPHNASAVALVGSWPDWPGPSAAVYGPPGGGKTHLAHVFAASAHAEIVAAGALEEAASRVLDGALRAAAVEDADRVAGLGLLHLLNAVAEKGGHVLLTAREAPSRWPVQLPDLASRLRALPAVGIGAPDDATLAAVLVKLFEDRQLRVSDEVVVYLAARIERSFDGARRIVAALDAASLAARREVTVALAREVLRQSDGVT
jgi:chromosomal replication initiation ATPase DnaA